MILLEFFLIQVKDEIELRKQKNLAELGEIDDETRIEMEGFRGGTYLRIELHGMPCEMVQYFDPSHPILVGGVGRGEETVGYMQVRLISKVSHLSCSICECVLYESVSRYKVGHFSTLCKHAN